MVATFFKILKERNPLFFSLGIALIIQFFLFLVFFAICQFTLSEICNWLKPSKFSLSFAVYAFTLGWYMEYLKGLWSPQKIRAISTFITILILMEMTVIFLQSLQNSHYLFISKEFDAIASRSLYIAANAIILVNTVIFLYIGIQFFRKIPLEPISYLWSIRSGFVMFTFSAFIGIFLIERYGQMPIDSTHYGIPFTKFSTTRDNLISLHFLGIHYLQLLPLSVYFLQKYAGKIFVLSCTAFYLFLFVFAYAR